MLEKNLIDIKRDLQNFKKDKDNLLLYYVQKRLDKTMLAYIDDIHNSSMYLINRDSKKVIKAMEETETSIQSELSLEEQILRADNPDELNNLVELFNVNLQKKNIVRSAKLSDVQDKVVEQMYKRLDKRADEFSNDDLIKYHTAIQSTLSKNDTTMENVKIPTVQINQQVNVGGDVNLNSESRKKVIEAVKNILAMSTTESQE